MKYLGWIDIPSLKLNQGPLRKLETLLNKVKLPSLETLDSRAGEASS